MTSRRLIRFALAGSLALVAAFAARVRADADTEWEARREQERKNYDTMVSNMPLLNERSITSLFQLRLEGKSLVLRTTHASTAGDGYMRAKFQDTALSALIRIQGGARTEGAVIPAALQFNLTDYTKPRQIGTLSINTQLAYLSISKSGQFPSGYRNTSLMQQGNPTSDSGALVQLTVNEAGRAGALPLNIDLQAADFFALIRGHPRECDEYLRPILRDLGQESVFAPDPLIAWQVFADQWKPDDKVRTQVLALLPALDDDDYRERAKASRELEKLGREGAAVLIHLDRGRLSPEQNARVDRALGPYAQLPVRQAAHLRADPGFLLDCLYSDDPTLRHVALLRLRQVADPSLEMDMDGSIESRLVAIAAIRRKMFPVAGH